MRTTINQTPAIRASIIAGGVIAVIFATRAMAGSICLGFRLRMTPAAHIRAVTRVVAGVIRRQSGVAGFMCFLLPPSIPSI